MKNKFGFRPDVIEEKHFKLGAIAPEILQVDGQWDEWFPMFEAQNKGFETYNCTGFSCLNALEMLFEKKFALDTNNSDRFLGIKAGTDPNNGGNSLHDVAQAIRHAGCIPESLLPFDVDSVEDFYSFKDSDKRTCEKEGKSWLDKYTYGHEWVCVGNETPEKKKELIKYGLTLSPLAISVYAWYPVDGIYISQGSPNHAVCAYGWEERGVRIYDSYEEDHKVVAWDNIGQAKRFSISKGVKKLSWLDLLKRFFRVL